MLKVIPRSPKLSSSFQRFSLYFRHKRWKNQDSQRGWQNDLRGPKIQTEFSKSLKKNSRGSSTLLLLAGVGFLFGTQNHALAEEDFSQDEEEENNSHVDDLVAAQDEATKVLKLFREKIGAPGVVAIVTHHGRIVYHHAEGYSDVENLVPMQPNTPLRIASISKTLTAVALMKLVQDGKIDLDAPVQKYIPDFPVKSEGTITVRHLASHLSGIRHYANADEFQSKVNYKTIEDAVKVFQNDPLQFPPGTQYLYSTFGYTLLSRVIENAAGTPFLKYVQKEILSPLRMNDTFPDIPSKIVPHIGHYYYRTKKGENFKLVNAPWVDNSNKWAGGGFVSTTQDIATLGNSILHNTILHSDYTQQMMTPQPNAVSKKLHQYGLGIHLYNLKRFPRYSKSKSIYGHSGGACGATTELILLPEDDMVVAMMTNLGNAPPLRTPSLKLAQLFLEVEGKFKIN